MKMQPVINSVAAISSIKVPDPVIPRICRRRSRNIIANTNPGKSKISPIILKAGGNNSEGFMVFLYSNIGILVKDKRKHLLNTNDLITNDPMTIHPTNPAF
jgi:hypothetical protein